LREIVVYGISANANSQGILLYDIFSKEGVNSLGAVGGHTTRTIVFGLDNTMYVSVGSLNNVDVDSSRSRIRSVKFTDDAVPIGTCAFQNTKLIL
jgi:glucose/arabinose dehydrogenase